MSDELRRFEYINGTLFNERLPLADYDHKMRAILLECSKLNWGYISPAIFGAMFQGVMNPQERRELGAHYTSEENILKVINPLSLDELWEEFERIKGNSKQLEHFHEKLASLKFLDLCLKGFAPPRRSLHMEPHWFHKAAGICLAPKIVSSSPSAIPPVIAGGHQAPAILA